MMPTMGIRTLRRLRGWNQDDLADVTGLSQSTISRAEKLDDRVTMDVFKRIAAALEAKLADLFIEDSDKARLVMQAYLRMSPSQREMMDALATTAASSPPPDPGTPPSAPASSRKRPS